MLVRGDLDQHSAQAAAWNLQNGLTWQELAEKIGVKHINGTTEAYFSGIHLQRALLATRLAEKSAKDAPPYKTAPSIGDQAAQQ
jgi:hypothetical protein